MRPYDPLYIAFLREFNVNRDYYECHEVMETLWLEEGRKPFYQGLLQIAVGLYHHQNANVSGAVKLMESGIAKLQGYPDMLLGINLALLLRDAEAYLIKLRNNRERPFEPYPLDIRIVGEELAGRVSQLQAGPETDREES
ncbi:DUF309 domain-containing protein [Paenibacillus sp. UNC499MF]|uniref:DUF309 domain-containing protein n=1 Tax=Paenibacillus sp. UNC499MF TaxID=1502751 RepID=UPI00089FCBAF|nr:DUF309 domain-containing protein [Paenibacillus sp. UNC499MF]SEG73050.1 hypothetical protein SAMN02799616_04589 [Paenibacillus sp. UNC499MF]